MSLRFPNLAVAFSWSGSVLDISVQGALTESSTLPDLPDGSFTVLRFDVTNISHINSGGVRIWLIWIKGVAAAHPTTKMQFANVPYVFFRQIGSIAGFVPPSAWISSMQAPFVCPACNAEQMIMLSEEKNYSRVQSTISIPMVPCKSCGTKMDIDDNSKNFLISLIKI